VRELLGIDSLKVLNYTYKTLRLHVRPVVEARKGSGVVKGLLSREGAHFLGWNRDVENDGLWVVSLSGHL
jgi:hypothetical protein